MNGKYIIIKLGNTAIAALKSVNIQTSAKTEELSNAGISAAENMWERSITTKLKWSISTDQLIVADSAIATSVLRNGTSYRISVYKSATDSTAILTGMAICTKASVKAAIGALVKGSFTFEGNGPLAPP